jgi:hypothetical protein
MTCEKSEVLVVGQVAIWQLEEGKGLFYQAGMAIDADGAPTAYHPEPDSAAGLDYLANAGHSGNWWGLVTNTGEPDGEPVVQGPSDPAPGFYVSTTSLQDKTRSRTDPLRYVDSSTVPYVVLPRDILNPLSVRLGDFATAINLKTGQVAGAIFADVGPAGKIGEGSIALADAVQVPSSPKHGGVDSGIVYVIYPGSGNGNPRSLEEIESEAGTLFEAFGALGQIQECFPLEE